MEAIKTYIIDFWQSEMVQEALHRIIAFILSFIDMEVIHDDVFIIIFAILIFIGLFFLVAIYTQGVIRAVSIFFAFLMMIGAMTIYGSVRTGLLEVKFDEAKLQARAELERKRAEENKPPEIPPAVPQYPLNNGSIPMASSGSQANLGLPESEKIHWEIYDPYEKPHPWDNMQKASGSESDMPASHGKSIEVKPEESPEVKAEKARIGKEIALIEADLSHNIIFIDEHMADLDRKTQRGEIDTNTALAQKARWGIEKQGMILDALDEKAAVLSRADLLADSDKANDMRNLNKQRQAVADKLTEYQNILQQIDGTTQATW